MRNEIRDARRPSERLPYVWDYDNDETRFRALLTGREAMGRLDRDWAAGLFPVDLARPLLGATLSDWELIRWIEAPPAEDFLADVRRLGEELLLLEQ